MKNVVFSISTILVLILSISVAQQNIYAEEKCPCDIYADGGTPCVAAHSTIRALFGAYNGKLYQIRNEAGDTMDIKTLSAGGVANAAAQDSFCSGTSCVITIVYDQTTKGNDVYYQAPGSPVGGHRDMKIANAMKESIKLNGAKVYSIYLETEMAFWADGSKSGMPLGAEPQGVYMVASGTHTNTGCCFDYGNAETSRTPFANAAMDAVALSADAMWGSGAGSGPWVMGDFENGLFTDRTLRKNMSVPSMTQPFVTAMEKNNGTTEWAIKGADATTGGLTTFYKGELPDGYSPMKKQGAIVLGSGGDCCINVANGAAGTFYEGCIVSGYPSDETEDAIQANIVAAGYGRVDPVVSTMPYTVLEKRLVSPLTIRYNSSNMSALIQYNLQETRNLTVTIFDQRGRRIAAIADGIVPAGKHTAVWNAEMVPAGVYVCRVAVDGTKNWAGKIIVGK